MSFSQAGVTGDFRTTDLGGKHRHGALEAGRRSSPTLADSTDELQRTA
jgi:hypothetical protein